MSDSRARAARRLGAFLVTLLAVLGTFSSSAAARTADHKKAIWGPVRVNGVSQFPIYRQLGVHTFETSLYWSTTAPTRPADPRDPADPAYRWPAEIDDSLAQAAKYHMRVLLQVMDTPPWANGGRTPEWAPDRPADYASFLSAAARRYPAVHLWLIWAEPSKAKNFQPLVPVVYGHSVTAAQRAGPQRYAQMLDAAYGVLKAASRRNLVIGGNTWTVGAVPPLSFIRLLRLPNGRPPRMDLYGHNPFSARAPDFGNPSLGHGHADFSDLDTLSAAVDRQLARPRGKRHLRLFLAEFTIPTDHANWEFNFWVSEAIQAQWLRDSLRIARSWSRIYALGWLSLYDDPPRPDGQQVDRGLITDQGRRKPSFDVFARG
ncbi:MAG: strH [Solirubrobacterales bacterium]|nr:strH [Solirubrobacterales bacterium]